jgi:cyclopropane fatty-acyl-phospholipid synthase-like methyltransferase
VKLSNSQEVKSYYSEWWENPKDIRNAVFESLNQHVKQRIPPGRGKRALDVGSGRGRIVSYLIEKGYDVSAVEFNEEFVAGLKARFPSVRVVLEDVRNINFSGSFDIVTCIELAQNLNKAELLAFLSKLARVTQLLLINISNRNSFHSRWVEFRRWKADFVFNYTPKEFEGILQQAGFDIKHRRGIGLITPISLFKGFKGKLVPIWLAKTANKLDPLFPKICHLYYVEATSSKL